MKFSKVTFFSFTILFIVFVFFFIFWNTILFSQNTFFSSSSSSSSSSSYEISKPNAVIYILAQKKRVSRLINLLEKLELYFNNRYNYPILIFIESNFDEATQAKVLNSSTSEIIFYRINFTCPSYFPDCDSIKVNTSCPHVPQGYRHMCRFHSITAHEILEKLGYDWYWRLDDDSTIFGNITFEIFKNQDVFRLMQEKDLIYGYWLVQEDHPACVYGLWDSVNEYIQINQIIPTFFDPFLRTHVYYNNFEIGSQAFFRSPSYKNYIDYIDRLGGFFTSRWGDAPVKTLAISIFVPSTKVFCFANLPYRH